MQTELLEGFSLNCTFFIFYETLLVGGLVSIKTKFDRKVSGKMWFGTTSRLNFAIEEQWFDMRSKSYIHIYIEFEQL